MLCEQKTSGKNDGTSWADAYVTLDSALKSAACSEIWVAQGVYKPSGSYPFVFFGLNSGVALYGGFAGIERSLGEREPTKNLTLLSGDIDDNDIHASTDQVDRNTDDIVGSNSPVVLLLDGSSGISFPPSTIVDGFTITGSGLSGGLTCAGIAECSPTLRNLVFSGNAGGGASFTAGGSTASAPVLSNVGFSGSTRDEGGALYIEAYFAAGFDLVMTDVRFENNSGWQGAALSVNSTGSGVSSVSIVRGAFSRNKASSKGGAIAIYQSAASDLNVSISETTFDNNSALKGGAVFAEVYNSPLITKVANSTFAGNVATAEGGAVALELGDARGTSNTFNNVTFSENRAVGDGMSEAFGGAIYLSSGPRTSDVTLNVNNTILWDDVAGGSRDGLEIFNDLSSGGATVSVTHSVASGGCPLDTICSDISSADPLLAPLAMHWGPTSVMRPGLFGSAVNAGDDDTCEITDQRGFIRPQGAHCDIGAVEIRLPSDDMSYPSSF